MAPAVDLVYVHRNETDVHPEEYRAVSEAAAFRVLALALDAR